MNLTPGIQDSMLYRAYGSYRNPRLENEGSNFLSQKHKQELIEHSEIVDWDEYAKPENIPGVGTLRHIGVTSKQGYGYETLVGIPEKQQSDVLKAGTTPYLFSLKGPITDLARKLMSDGHYVFFSGAEGSHRPAESPKPKTEISLANSAATLLSSTQRQVDALLADGHDIDPTRRYLIGPSRAGMIVLGAAAMSKTFEQKITGVHSIAPCVPERVKSLPRAGRTIEQVAVRPLKTVHLIGKLGIAKAYHYRNTFDLRPHSVQRQLAIGGALLSGEAGLFPAHIGLDQPVHLTFFEDDEPSMPDTWMGLFSQHHNVTSETRPGWHGSCVSPETLHDIVNRSRDDARLPYHNGVIAS